MRRDDIVPFAVKAIGVKIDAFHLIGRHPAAGGIGAAIQSAGHGQALRRRRLRDEIDDGLDRKSVV